MTTVAVAAESWFGNRFLKKKMINNVDIGKFDSYNDFRYMKK